MSKYTNYVIISVFFFCAAVFFTSIFMLSFLGSLDHKREEQACQDRWSNYTVEYSRQWGCRIQFPDGIVLPERYMSLLLEDYEENDDE